VSASAQTDRLGDYHIVRELSRSRSILAQDAQGRCCVLKRLPRDCLLGEQLHPNIRQRLQRVRELADLRVASLRGVERIEGQAYLVWDYVEGEALADRASDVTPALLRDIALAVESLHGHGLVHGAIHARNVILTGEQDRQVRLTHVSPLLYDEPRDDCLATIAMFESLFPDATWNHSLRQLLRSAKDQPQPLAWLRGRLRLSASSEDANPSAETLHDNDSRRRKLRVLASVLLILGIAFSAILVWWSLNPSSTQPPPPVRAGNLVSPAPSP
jgi:hypothetical protein